MDALMFLKEANKICKAHPDCNNCPLRCTEFGGCMVFTTCTNTKGRERVVHIVEEWSKAHSTKKSFSYTKEVDRMCTSYSDCKECPLSTFEYCNMFFTKEEKERARRIVKEWSESHPEEVKNEISC